MSYTEMEDTVSFVGDVTTNAKNINLEEDPAHSVGKSSTTKEEMSTQYFSDISQKQIVGSTKKCSMCIGPTHGPTFTQFHEFIRKI